MSLVGEACPECGSRYLIHVDGCSVAARRMRVAVSAVGRVVHSEGVVTQFELEQVSLVSEVAPPEITAELIVESLEKMMRRPGSAHPIASIAITCANVRRLIEDRKEQAHKLAVANAYAAELEQRVDIWRKRVDHADIEAAQARVSRDGSRAKLMSLLALIKSNGIELEYGEDG